MMSRWHPASRRCPARAATPRPPSCSRPSSAFNGVELNIFATLAHHPRLLKRWSDFGGVLLYGGKLPARERELLILRTGYLCQAPYEWGQHVTIGLAAGLTDEEIARVAAGPDADGLVRRRRHCCCGPPTSSTPTAASATTPGPRWPRRGTSSSSSSCAWWWASTTSSPMTLNSLGVEPETDDFPALPA